MKASSNFEHRYVNEQDYKMLCKWWEENSFTPPPLDFLSKYGIIVSKKDEDGKMIDLYAGFLYFTGTAFGIMEFIVGNKNAPIYLKRGALNRLVDIFSIIAKDKGVSALFTFTNLDGYKNSLVKTGFGVTDRNNYHLIKKI